MRKICIFVGSRANYSSIRSVMKAVRDHNELQLQTIIGASAIKEWFEPSASFCRVFLSLTTTNRHSCRFPADGASLAASRTRANFSSSTSRGRYDLTLFLNLMSSYMSMASIFAAAKPPVKTPRSDTVPFRRLFRSSESCRSRRTTHIVC